MNRIVLLLLVSALIFYGLKAFQNADPAKVARIVRQSLFVTVILLLLLLGASGHLNGLFALLGLLLTFAVRALPQLIRYVPFLHRLWREFLASKQGYSTSQNNKPHSSGAMTKEEAYDVLGLSDTASEEEIIAAHRKLMQKLHPDRGGSDYLATKINLAKKILIKK